MQKTPNTIEFNRLTDLSSIPEQDIDLFMDKQFQDFIKEYHLDYFNYETRTVLEFIFKSVAFISYSLNYSKKTPFSLINALNDWYERFLVGFEPRPTTFLAQALNTPAFIQSFSMFSFICMFLKIDANVFLRFLSKHAEGEVEQQAKEYPRLQNLGQLVCHSDGHDETAYLLVLIDLVNKSINALASDLTIMKTSPYMARIILTLNELKDVWRIIDQIEMAEP